MANDSQARCLTCNQLYVRDHHSRKYCGDECAYRMRMASASCASRLRSANNSIDHRCKYCGEQLGPVDMTGLRSFPGNRSVHAECKNADTYQVVGFCECGAKMRKRDGNTCTACQNRKARAEALKNPLPCSVEWCDNDAYPTMSMCSKHRNDMRRFGEPRRYVIDREWAANDQRISQSDVRKWRKRLLQEQGGKCALCGSSETGRWHLDHDHRCCPGGRMCERCVRAVLCNRCNVSLGGFQDDPAMLRRAADYIESHRQSALFV